MKLRQLITAYLTDASYQPMTKEELAQAFEIENRDRENFYALLRELEREGRIRVGKKDRIQLQKLQTIRGKLSASDRGFAFLVPEDGTKDVFIPAGARKGAMHGDTVEIRITEPAEGDNKNAVGKVVRINERSRSEIVGTFYRKKKFGYVEPDDPKFDADIFLAKDQLKGLKDGDKVVVNVKYAKDERGPAGEVVERIGKSGSPGVDITSIARTFQLPYQFSKKTLREVEAMDATVVSDSREDFRDDFTVTIDGPNAKDFDDAIGIRKEGNEYILRVHIADVAHYVQANSATDRDAYQRGNSVYLLDRVIPMLPERLSNDLCSLRPGEDRYTQTVSMRIDANGDVLDYEMFQSVIRSDYRLLYPDVSNYVEGLTHPYTDPVLMQKLDWMKELYEIVEAMHTRKGSLDFSFAESEITLDPLGNPVDVKRAERRTANRIIEEFMVLTNEVVGSHFAHLEIPFLYRVHEKPSEEKATALRTILHNFGYPIRGKEIRPTDLQKVLEASEGKREQPLLHMLILRSLSKARYEREPDVHFGLASKFYSHFTAPIRRYSDLVVHRILKQHLEGKAIRGDARNLGKLDEIAEHVSEMERRAEEAEREVDDLKKSEYMAGFIGQEFDGIVTSITSFGLFIQLENTVEGLVHVRDLSGYYEFDESRYMLKKRGSEEGFRLGDVVRIVVEGVDIDRRQIDFQLTDGGDSHESARAE